MTNHIKTKKAKKGPEKPEVPLPAEPAAEEAQPEILPGVPASELSEAEKEAAVVPPLADGRLAVSGFVPSPVTVFDDAFWLRILAAAALAGGKRPAEACNLAKDTLAGLKKLG